MSNNKAQRSASASRALTSFGQRCVYMAAKIRDDDLAQIRESSDLVEIISSHVNLKKTGRIFKGLCPFHKEKTPSFVVDPQKQLFHCFGCGEGGDVFTFLMKTENLDFVEAVEVLASKLGHKIAYESQKDDQKASKRERIKKANLLAQRYFSYLLTQAEAGKRAQDYLLKRGITKDSIEKFSLGFSPASGRALFESLLKKGFSQKELASAGLVTESERGPLDLFRGRIIFPITDLKGDTIAFGGRILGEGLPKYINTPETDLFRKGLTLYNLKPAKGEMVAANKVIVVEGYTDVITLSQAGIGNVVATLGTALTGEHLNLLSRFVEKVILVFDSDKAGKAAAERGVGFLGQSKVDIYVATLPNDLDPADFILRRGAEEFSRFIDGAAPLAEYSIKRILAKHDLKSLTGQKRAIKEVLSLINNLESELEREGYLTRLSDKFKVSFESLLSELKKVKGTSQAKEEESTLKTALSSQERCEREMLKMALQEPESFADLIIDLGEELFTGELNRKVFETIKKGREEERIIQDLSDLKDDPLLMRYISALSLERIEADKEDLANHFKDNSIWLKDFYLERQINKLKAELKEIAPKKEKEKESLLFKDLVELEKERRELKETIRSFGG